MLLFALGFVLGLAAETKTISVIKDNGNWKIVKGDDKSAVARGTYVVSRAEKGFNDLTIDTNANFGDDDQMYAAGLIDGYFSGSDIKNHLDNMNAWNLEHYLNHAKDYPKSVYDYMEKNLQFVEQSIAANPTDPYWTLVGLIMQQVHGITDGYNLVAKKGEEMSFSDMFLYNSFGDMLDLQSVLPGDNEKRQVPWWIRFRHDPAEWHWQWKLRTKCSGLVRYVAGDHDIYVSQSAWFTYGAMTRVMKHFTFNLKHSSVASKTVSFSSYPGFVFSFDDFYETSHGLTIFETTFSNFNDDLWQYVVPTTVLDWIRITVAVRAATDGPSFKTWFEPHNSGTYNNQWVVVDYNVFATGTGVPKGTLTIVEQLPGNMFIGDMSELLESQGYFGSYNTPWLQETIELAHVMENAQGNDAFWNSPTECCRANIFARDAPKVDTLDAMKKIMKYNDYKNEPLSKDPRTGLQDPGASIAARYDLRPPELKTVCFGQLDAKIGTKETNKQLSFHVQMGPTHDVQPVLDIDALKQSGMFCPAIGVVSQWNFDWEVATPATFN